MTAFPPVRDHHVARLEALLGKEHVLVDEAACEPYARDATEDLRHAPEVVVRCGSTDEVAGVLALASEAGLPVTPRAAGTGMSGGALPLHGGIVLSVERMDAIKEIDEADLVAVVEPGVVTGVLQDAVAARGLSYPPDPASRGTCMIGGNIAEDAGGPHCVKYGTTREYVLGLEAVTAAGDVFRTGGRTRKDVAGYDLTRLLVGSEGTLAVVTEATLRLVVPPAAHRLLLAPFGALDAAGAAIPALRRARLVPAALEIVDRPALEAAEHHQGRRLPHPPAEAVLLVELDGRDERTVEEEAARAGEVLLEAGAIDVLPASSAAHERELWAARRCLGEAIRHRAGYVECDAAVPPSRVPDLLRGVRAIATAQDVDVIAFGHAGDGNIHVNLVSDEPDGAVRRRRLAPAVSAVHDLAVSLGGTITGEHGVGCVGTQHLRRCRDPVAIEAMRAIKTALDPSGILNPGKILAPVPPGEAPAAGAVVRPGRGTPASPSPGTR